MSENTDPSTSADADLSAERAAQMAKDLGIAEPWTQPGLATRLFYFADSTRLLIVAGEQSGTEAEKALAWGMTWRGARRLVLVLPADRAFATLQRIAWFTDEHRPVVHTHDGDQVSAPIAVDREERLSALEARIPKGADPVSDLRSASTALHLGDLHHSISELADWATEAPELDASHRQSYRAWHHLGQSVLQLEKSGPSVTIRGGTNDKGNAHDTFRVTVDHQQGLSKEQLAACKAAVWRGIDARRKGALHKPDEHYLQALLRLAPHLAGVEQPALREVPAWRPPSAPAKSPTKALNRGYVDLLGLDGNGDIRVVETKLAKADDAMLILQGLDYFVWAQVYAEALRARLGASKKAQIRLAYLVGAEPGGKVRYSKYSQALVDAIDRAAVPMTYLGITGWFGDSIKSEVLMLDPDKLPASR